jgi:hypothetical protein
MGGGIHRAICDLHIHCSCVHITDSDQLFFTFTGKSSYKCLACTKLLRSTRNDETPVKLQHSISIGYYKVISPDRQLSLPELPSNGSPLHVQIETLRLNGQATINLVEKLLLVVTNLTTKVTQLKSDNSLDGCKTFCPKSHAIQKQQLGLCPPNLEPCHTKTSWQAINISR